MSQVTLHSKPIVVGDKVWHILYGWLTVIELKRHSEEYPIILDGCTFTQNGYNSIDEKSPTIFWKKQEFDLSKPLPDLKVDAKVTVWLNKYDKTKHTRHFSHFDEQGKIYCFDDGRTSWTDVEYSPWDNYEIVEEDDENSKICTFRDGEGWWVDGDETASWRFYEIVEEDND